MCSGAVGVAVQGDDVGVVDEAVDGGGCDDVGARGPSLQVLSAVPPTCDSRLHPSDRAFVTSNKPGAAAGSGEVRLGELNP